MSSKFKCVRWYTYIYYLHSQSLVVGPNLWVAVTMLSIHGSSTVVLGAPRLMYVCDGTRIFVWWFVGIGGNCWREKWRIDHVLGLFYLFRIENCRRIVLSVEFVINLKWALLKIIKINKRIEFSHAVYFMFGKQNTV